MRRRLKQTDVADAIHSRRRSQGNFRPQKDGAKARRKVVQTVIACMFALAVLIVISGTLIYIAFTTGTTGPGIPR